MTDAFYRLMPMANLGRDYMVWDKAASIRYRKPGKGRSAPNSAWRTPHFDDIRDKLETLPKCEPTFFMWKCGSVEVKDDQGEVVAAVEKLVHVGKKRSES
jgi:hypothetical protein